MLTRVLFERIAHAICARPRAPAGVQVQRQLSQGLSFDGLLLFRVRRLLRLSRVLFRDLLVPPRAKGMFFSFRLDTMGQYPHTAPACARGCGQKTE